MLALEGCLRCFIRLRRQVSQRKVSFWPIFALSLSLLTFDTLLVYRNEKVGPQRIFNTWHTMETANGHRYILYWNVVMAFICFLKILSYIFFGGLRSTEIEHLVARTSLCLTDTCLILMLMKTSFDSNLFQPLLLLFIAKWARWILEDRLEFIESRLNIPRNQIIKIIIVLSFTLFLNTYQFITYFKSAPALQPDPTYAFILEYSLELIDIIKLVYCYFLFAYEISITDDITFNRTLLILYGNLVATGISLICQVNFFFLLVSNMIFPFISVRSFMMNLKEFRKNLKAVVQSRRAIAIMDSQFPTATADDIANFDAMCIVCREDMSANPGACKKLPCGHILHLSCLRSWFQRQQNCPLCRSSILSANQNRNAQADNANQRAQNQNANNNNNNENAPNQAAQPDQAGMRQRRPRGERMPELGLIDDLNVQNGGDVNVQDQANNNRRRRPTRAPSSDSTSRSNPRNINVDLELLKSTISSVVESFAIPQPYGIDVPDLPEDMSDVAPEALAELEAEMRISAQSRLRHLKRIHNMMELTNIMMNSYNKVQINSPSTDASVQASQTEENNPLTTDNIAPESGNDAEIHAESMLDELD